MTDKDKELIDRLTDWVENTPVQHEIPEKGCCTYNWGRFYIQILKQLSELDTPSEEAVHKDTVAGIGKETSAVGDTFSSRQTKKEQLEGKELVCIKCGTKLEIRDNGMWCHPCEMRYGMPLEEYILAFGEIPGEGPNPEAPQKEQEGEE